ncbi:MAG: LysR family transcriptional regulator [Pseudomonadota bacterium]
MERSKFSFRAVEAFVASVEGGSVTAAARRLGTSVSSVSLQLSNLETALGVRLLERNAQRFALTQAGETFHPRALRILDDVMSAGAAVSRSGSAARLVMKVAVIEDFDATVLPRWLSRLSDDLPGIRFRVQSGPSHDNHTALANRSVDMIVAVDFSDPVDWVEQHAVLRDPYVLAVASSAPEDPSLGDLMAMPFVRYSRELLMGRQIEAHLRRSQSVPPRGHEFSSNHAVLSTVEALRGWTITTATAYSSAAYKIGMRLLPLPFPAFSRTISLHARRDALGDLPTEFAAALRTILQSSLVQPFANSHPRMTETLGLRVIDASNS